MAEASFLTSLISGGLVIIYGVGNCKLYSGDFLGGNSCWCLSLPLGHNQDKIAVSAGELLNVMSSWHFWLLQGFMAAGGFSRIYAGLGNKFTFFQRFSAETPNSHYNSRSCRCWICPQCCSFLLHIWHNQETGYCKVRKGSILLYFSGELI